MKKYLNTIAKGFGMGAANVVPGVSGGTIALLTCIYTDIINSLNALIKPSTWKSLLKLNIKQFWQDINGNFLTSLFIGVLLSLISLAKLMHLSILYYPVQTWAFFFGLIIASCIYLFSEVKKWTYKDFIITFIGIILGIGISFLSPTTTPNNLWFIFLCGAITICTMILPGISGSFVLVLLGKYDYIMGALSQPIIYWKELAVFIFGCIVGILAFAKLLHWLLSKWERQTLLLLLGFIVGSLVKVWPWSNILKIYTADLMLQGTPSQQATEMARTMIENNQPYNPHIVGAIIFCVLGIILVVGLEQLRKVKNN